MWTYFKARPHLYANANKACGTEANANECQKVACSAFVTQANEQEFRWLFVGCPNKCTSTSVRLQTYFSLKYRLQTDSNRLLAKHTPHKWMKVNAVRLHVHIMCFVCVFAFTYRCGHGLEEASFIIKHYFHLKVCENDFMRSSTMNKSCKTMIKQEVTIFATKIPQWDEG